LPISRTDSAGIASPACHSLREKQAPPRALLQLFNDFYRALKTSFYPVFPQTLVRADGLLPPAAAR
jgi:hypothetical protein